MTATKTKGFRCTKARVGSVVATAKKYFGVLLTDDQAKTVIKADETLMQELRSVSEVGSLDTYTRDYLIMALIEVVLPGSPTIQDSMVFRPMKYWHWPCNGSNPEYAAAFYAAFRMAATKKGFKLVRGFPR
jgi:hypothetical protein